MKGKGMLLALLLLMGLMLHTDAAAAPREVRVGYYTFESYQEVDDQGNRSGYGYEYLHEIAKHTNWTYTYVPGSLEDSLNMLAQGELDLVTAIQYSPQRAEIFDFSERPLGSSYVLLSVKEGDKTYLREDYPNFNGMRVGLIRGNNNNLLLEEFAARMEFTYEPYYVGTEAELKQALEEGRVEAILNSSLRQTDGEQMIARFALTPFYAVVRKGDTALLQELNGALDMIGMVNPAYQFDLHHKYYGRAFASAVMFSPEEQEYLAQKRTIRVVTLQSAPPISYFDGEEYRGVVADVLALVTQDLGLEFQFLQCETYEQAVEMVGSHQADLVAIFEADYNWAERNNIRITSPYLELSYSAVTRLEGQAQVDSVATVSGTLLSDRVVHQFFQPKEVLNCTSPEEAIHMVDQGRADLALVDTYTAEYLLNSSYPRLKASVVYGLSEDMALGLSASCDPLLFSVLDKTVSNISSHQLSHILSQHTTFQQADMTMMDLIRRDPIGAMWMVGLLFLLVIGALFYRLFLNRRHAAKIFDLAFRDETTGLWNTKGFERQSRRRIHRSDEPCIGVAVLDLRRFSHINDSYGRQVGDLFIGELGHLLAQQSGERFLAGHINADRFAVLLLCGNRGELTREINRLCAHVESISLPNYPALLQSTVGVYPMDFESVDVSVAIDRAEAARGAAKRKSVQVQYYDEPLKAMLDRERLIGERLPGAIQQGDIQVHYQPRYDIRTRAVVGAEALTRWDDEVMGYLTPGKFIPVLEQSGEIAQLDFYVLEEACRMVSQARAEGRPMVPISVNQSRADFQQPDYIQRLREVLERYQVEAGSIELEITETLFGNESIMEDLVKKIKMLGLSISVDDFGTGYSSFHLLNRISVDTLKIDRAILKDAENRQPMRQILGKIVEMAQELGLNVVCEGVENARQEELLLELGCLYAQGFFFARAMEQEELQARIEGNIPNQ